MGTILYAKHLPESHSIIAQRIREEKPKHYVWEICEEAKPVINDFLNDDAMSFQEALKNLEEVKVGIRYSEGMEDIAKALREAQAEVIAPESLSVLEELQKFQTPKITMAAFTLSALAREYQLAKKTVSGEIQQPDEIGPEDFFTGNLLLRDPQEIISTYESQIQTFVDDYETFVRMGIEREQGVIEKLKSQGSDFFGYYGINHMTMVPSLQNEGASITGEKIGDWLFHPEEKYALIVKHEQLDLPMDMWRDENPQLDIDPAKKEEYLSLIPVWVGFYEQNKNRDTDQNLIHFFWGNLEKIKTSINMD